MASTAESIDPMSGLWSLMAFTLRQLRKQHRLSQSAVGRIVAADHKTISKIRLVPVDACLQVGLEGAFHLFSTHEREVGFVETPARGMLVTDPEDLRRLMVAFDRTSGRAVSPEATRARLQQMIEAYQ